MRTPWEANQQTMREDDERVANIERERREEADNALYAKIAAEDAAEEANPAWLTDLIRTWSSTKSYESARRREAAGISHMGMARIGNGLYVRTKRSA
jgi:hypothetical protein